MGQLQHGVYNDDCAGMSPAEVNAHYGFDEKWIFAQWCDMHIGFRYLAN